MLSDLCRKGNKRRYCYLHIKPQILSLLEEEVQDKFSDKIWIPGVFNHFCPAKLQKQETSRRLVGNSDIDRRGDGCDYAGIKVSTSGKLMKTDDVSEIQKQPLLYFQTGLDYKNRFEKKPNTFSL